MPGMMSQYLLINVIPVTLGATDSETNQLCVGTYTHRVIHSMACTVCKLRAYIFGLLKLNEVRNSTVLLTDLDGQFFLI